MIRKGVAISADCWAVTRLDMSLAVNWRTLTFARAAKTACHKQAAQSCTTTVVVSCKEVVSADDVLDYCQSFRCIKDVDARMMNLAMGTQ